MQNGTGQCWWAHLSDFFKCSFTLASWSPMQGTISSRYKCVKPPREEFTFASILKLTFSLGAISYLNTQIYPRQWQEATKTDKESRNSCSSIILLSIFQVLDIIQRGRGQWMKAHQSLHSHSTEKCWEDNWRGNIVTSSKGSKHLSECVQRARCSGDKSWEEPQEVSDT